MVTEEIVVNGLDMEVATSLGVFGGENSSA
jgi:hypothetical protein